MKTSAFEYDNIADKIFLPIYDVITDDIIKYTNITGEIKKLLYYVNISCKICQ